MEVVPVAADIFHENSWISGSALPHAVHPLWAVCADPGWAAQSGWPCCLLLCWPALALLAPARSCAGVAVGGWRVLPQKRGAASGGAEPTLVLKKSPTGAGGWKTKTQREFYRERKKLKEWK